MISASEQTCRRSTRTSSGSSKNSSTAKPASTTSIRWPTALTSCWPLTGPSSCLATLPASPPAFRLPEEAIIDIKNRSFSIVAEVENPDGDAEGILVTLGGETGGFAFLVLDRKPTFIYSWLGLEKYTIASSDPLPRGSCTIRFDFAYDGGGPGKGGTGTLSVNEKTVAEGRLEKTVPINFSTDDTFDVGEDWGTPVSSTYTPPFTFTCTLKKVKVQSDNQQTTDAFRPLR